MKPDGSGLHQVTRGAQVTSVSWAPDGTLWAGEGQSLVHLSQAGERLGEVGAPTLKWAPGAIVPFDVEVSPDGRKAGYTMYGQDCRSGCRAYEASGVVDLGSGQQLLADSWSDIENPAWVSDGRLLGSGGEGHDIDVRDIGGSSSTLLDDPNTDITDSTISADRRHLAFVTSTKYAVTAEVQGDVSGQRPGDASVRYACAFGPNGVTKDVDPVFAPDSKALAFAESDGIAIVPESVQPDGNACAALGSRIRYVGERGAHSPDWGAVAYDLSPRRPTVTPPGGDGGGQGNGGGGNGGGGGGTVDPPVEQPVTVKVSAPKATRAALRKGLTVTVTAPAAGTVKASLTLRGYKLASGTAKAKTAGTVKVKLSKLSARKAARLKGKTLKLTVTAGGSTTSRSFKVR